MAPRKDKPIGEPAAPTLPRSLERITADTFTRHSRWEDVEIVDADLALVDAVEPRLTSVRMDGGDIGDGRLAHLVVEDSEILRVNAANARAVAAVLRRTRLEAVRMTGVDLSQAELGEVSFAECRGDFATFNRARLVNVRFVDCNLREVDFGAARLDRVRFDRCDLAGADFSGAEVTRSEMRGCTIDDARGVASLSGMAMPMADILSAASVFAGALGVRLIGDEPG